MPDRARFELVIRDAGKPGDAPTINRLRRLLKSMLRAYGLRCVTIREIGMVNRPEKVAQTRL
jgi:hypothetical protein